MTRERVLRRIPGLVLVVLGAAGLPIAAAGLLCPEGGPNAGAAPSILVVPPGGARLAVCANGAPGQDASLVAGAVSVLDFRNPAAPAAVWSGAVDPDRFRVETIGEAGIRIRLETLLPKPGGPYEWVPFSSLDVVCRGQTCRPEPEECVLALAPDPKRDTTAAVQRSVQTGLPNTEALMRLTDDLLVQALTGEDRAAWLLDHLTTLFHVDGEGADNLTAALGLLKKARDLPCPGFPADKGNAGAAAAPAGDGLFHPVPRDRSRPPAPAPGGTAPAGVGPFTWLVGGRWEGRGAGAAGAEVHVEEIYDWGPTRRTVQFTSWNLAGGKRIRLYDGLFFHDEHRQRYVLWSIRPASGLTESEIPRADATGYEIEDGAARSKISRAGRDAFVWSLRTLQDGSWKESLTTTYKRLPR